MLATLPPYPDTREVDDLRALSTRQLEDMLAAGEEISECHRVLARANLNIVGECLKNQGRFYEYDHYPAGDVYDDLSHAQYYYHAHRGVTGEHGHFHTFMRVQGMPQGMTPVAHMGGEPWPRGSEVLSHLVAVSMDRQGFPIALFTTNRWVTGENWFHAQDVCRMLDSFVIDHAYPSWPVNRWISAMMVLFRPAVERLLRERDLVVARHERAHPLRDVFEDRELEMTSHSRIHVDLQLERVRETLRQRSLRLHDSLQAQG